MASGDREAFAVLFRRHQATVYRFSCQMLGSKEAAEDVTQDVFIALSRNARHFDPAVGSLTTYLYGVARNLILQRHKRRRTHPEVAIESINLEDPAAFAVDGDPTDELLRRQMEGRLRLAILRLPVHYREAIVLCELNGLSYEEAACVAGCPVGTIRSRLSRARKILIERCRAGLLQTESASAATPAAKDTKKWLILTKNNC